MGILGKKVICRCGEMRDMIGCGCLKDWISVYGVRLIYLSVSPRDSCVVVGKSA